jgi:TetR/AcrR family transcriptional repressor of nem operon
MNTSPGDRKSETHEAILASASRLMRQRGIAAASVAEVMGGAGKTVGGFYAHFRNKEALFNETLSRTARTMWTQLLSLADGKERSAALRAILGGYLSAAHRDDPAAGCALPTVAAEVTRLGEPYRSSLGGEIDAYAEELARVIGGRSARGRALALIALMLGGMSLSRALRGTAMSDEILAACRSFGAFALMAGDRSAR